MSVMFPVKPNFLCVSETVAPCALVGNLDPLSFSSIAGFWNVSFVFIQKRHLLEGPLATRGMYTFRIISYLSWWIETTKRRRNKNEIRDPSNNNPYRVIWGLLGQNRLWLRTHTPDWRGGTQTSRPFIIIGLFLFFYLFYLSSFFFFLAVVKCLIRLMS